MILWKSKQFLKLKNMLLKVIDNKRNIEKIINWKYPLLYIFFIKLIQIKKNILSLIRWDFKWYKNIEWKKDYYIKKDSFNFWKRKNWISAFWRLYNSEFFLEKVVESHINLFDEIILVDNNSNDKTDKICKKLQSKYPNIVKYYKYPFEIYKIWTKKYLDTKENSIHSLSYYYNWTLSKTSYKYVIKLDDDHLVINNNLKLIIDKIKKNELKCFLQIPLLNIYRYKNKLCYSYDSLKSSFAWLFWDFWFFPISEKTYFIKQKKAETIIFPLKIKNYKISLLHLKWLKPTLWLNNYWNKVVNKLILRLNHKNFKKLSKDYINILKEYWIK